MPAADGPPAIGAASAARPELRAEPSAAATPSGGLDPVAASEAMTAMLAATVPGVNFGDPLGTGGPAEMPAMPQDQDTSFPNGSEPAS